MEEKTRLMNGNEAEASPSPKMQQNVENDEKGSGKFKQVAGNVASGVGGAVLGGAAAVSLGMTIPPKDGPQLPGPDVKPHTHTHTPKPVAKPVAKPVEQTEPQGEVEKSPIVIEVHHVTDKPVVDVVDTADAGDAPVEHFTIDPSVNPVFAVAHSTDIPINAINVPGNLYPTEPTEYYTYEEHVHVHLDHDDISS